MAHIRFFGPATLLATTAITLAGATSSASIDMQSLLYGSLEAVWTGTLTGTFKVEGSNNNSTFYDTGTITTAATGAAGGQLINIGFPVGFRWIRLTYTNASGSGNLTISGTGKGTS